MPETAPLVFPAIGNALEAEDQKGNFKKSQKFISRYTFDKGAEGQFVKENRIPSNKNHRE